MNTLPYSRNGFSLPDHNIFFAPIRFFVLVLFVYGTLLFTCFAETDISNIALMARYCHYPFMGSFESFLFQGCLTVAGWGFMMASTLGPFPNGKRNYDQSYLEWVSE